MKLFYIAYNILSYPILSYPILSYPILSYPILSYHIISFHIISSPTPISASTKSQSVDDVAAKAKIRVRREVEKADKLQEQYDRMKGERDSKFNELQAFTAAQT